MRILKYLFFSLSMISLLGCQQIQQQKIAQRNAESLQREKASFAECSEGTLTRKNALERRDCIDSASLQYFEEINYPFMWIVTQYIAANRDSAVKYSEGKISREAYTTAVKQHFADGQKTAYEASQQNMQIQAQAQAQRQAAAVAILGSMYQAPQPMPQPYMMPVQQNRSVNTNCNVVGQSVQCNSY